MAQGTVKFAKNRDSFEVHAVSPSAGPYFLFESNSTNSDGKTERLFHTQVQWSNDTQNIGLECASRKKFERKDLFDTIGKDLVEDLRLNPNKP